MHRSLSLFIAAALIAVVVAPASSASAAAVRGGGVVSGPPGVTSQLGFTASSEGGSFLCVMAGRSGKFAFASWERIDQMHVQGTVEPGSLWIAPDGSTSSFEGTADIHVTGLAGGSIEAATLTDVHFVSTQTEGGAGVAWHLLELPDLGLSFGPAVMASGRITIWP
jgi:hypothetical protein